MAFVVYILIISVISMSWYIMYQIGRGNGIQNGIHIGRKQILKEDIERLDNSKMTDVALIDHLPNLKEEMKNV